MAESRYYVSDIIEPNPAIGRIPRVATITDPQAGNALAFRSVYRQSAALPWALCVCRGNRHSLARGVAGIVPWPVLTIDSLWDAADVTERTAFAAALESAGIDLSGVSLRGTSVRQLVQLLGDRVDVAEGASGFDADTFQIET